MSHSRSIEDMGWSSQNSEKLLAPTDKHFKLEWHVQSKPYYDAILKLWEIEYLECPYQKIRLFGIVNNKIFDCINAYWANVDVDPEKLIIAADQMVLIYLYIAIWSKVPNFFAHLKYI